MTHFSAAILLCLLQAASSAQSGPPPSPTAPPSTAQTENALAPNDPKALLEAAQRVNGLSGPEIKPWHMKASYEVFENDGKTRDKGTFEEWWVSEKEAKWSYNTQHLAFTKYITDQGAYRVGETTQRTGAESRVQAMLTTSTIHLFLLSQLTLTSKETKIGTVNLRCVEATDKQPRAKHDDFQAKTLFCFDSLKPILRLFSWGSSVMSGVQDVRNNITLFQNRYLARKIICTRNGKNYLSIDLDLIETMDQIDQAAFKPPPNAITSYDDTKIAAIDEPTTRPRILHSVDPVFPMEAKNTSVEGEVTVEEFVGTDGRGRDMVALDGLPVFREAALKAVGQYTFSPATRNGVPVPALINIVIDFQLH